MPDTSPAVPEPGICITHAVMNQPLPLAGYNAYLSDQALCDAVEREGGRWGARQLAEYGALAGGDLMEIGRDANDNLPRLRAFDRFGHRINVVDFHPAYHRSLAIAKEHGLHSLTWTDERKAARVVRSALFYLHNQAESGTMCSITITHASVALLQHHPSGLTKKWLPGILSNVYDPADAPAERKLGLTVGMGITEKQGGSDIRANTTRAVPVAAGGTGEEYWVTGHKWFLSVPMSDAFLVLAQAAEGPSCFLMPRWRDDGRRNTMDIERLKDKLGDRSNATAEVEFRGAQAFMVGEPGRGIATLLEMVSETRLDCMLGSAGLMRKALVEAIHHCCHRKTFGSYLADQPLMQNVLADMALESEAAVALAMRLARACGSDNARERLLARMGTPIGKYWVCKRAPALVSEAQECLGGNGYIEESILPRLFRQAPVNSIWEGSANIQCLDFLRALSLDKEALDALHAELGTARGLNAAFDAHCDRLKEELAKNVDLQARARQLCEDVALALSASVLLKGKAADVGQAYCAARLGEKRGLAFGTLPENLDFARLVARAGVGV